MRLPGGGYQRGGQGAEGEPSLTHLTTSACPGKSRRPQAGRLAQHACATRTCVTGRQQQGPPTALRPEIAATHRLRKLLAQQAEVDAGVGFQQARRQRACERQRGVNVARHYPLAHLFPHLDNGGRTRGEKGQAVAPAAQRQSHTIRMWPDCPAASGRL